MQNRKRAVFFARVKNSNVLDRNEFYAIDLQILRELDFDVQICTIPWLIPSGDLYFVWWWTWAFFPVVRAKLAGKPVIIVGTFDHLLPNGLLENFPNRSVLHRLIIQYALRTADANVVVSMDQMNYLRTHFQVRGLSYSPHVIDVGRYRPSPAPRENFILSFCWMNSGNARRKCIPELIQAMVLLHRNNPDLKLVICGEKGNDYAELEHLVQTLAASEYIQFPGVVSKSQKIDLMQRCRVYAQPSHAEGFGVAILEAMSCGAPIVTSRVGAVPEVAGDTALYADGSNPAEIEGVISLLVENTPIAGRLGEQARLRAEEVFPFVRRKNDLKRIINNVLNG